MGTPRRIVSHQWHKCPCPIHSDHCQHLGLSPDKVSRTGHFLAIDPPLSPCVYPLKHLAVKPRSRPCGFRIRKPLGVTRDLSREISLRQTGPKVFPGLSEFTESRSERTLSMLLKWREKLPARLRMLML